MTLSPRFLHVLDDLLQVSRFHAHEHEIGSAQVGEEQQQARREVLVS